MFYYFPNWPILRDLRLNIHSLQGWYQSFGVNCDVWPLSSAACLAEGCRNDFPAHSFVQIPSRKSYGKSIIEPFDSS